MDSLLIIEDDNSTLIRLKRVFERKDFYVSIARNIEEGLDVFIREKPSCILMDLHFPDGHGLEDFYTKLLELQDKYHLTPCPIVVLTASDAEEDLSELVASGIYAIHNKNEPIDLVAASVKEEITRCRRSVWKILKGGKKRASLTRKNDKHESDFSNIMKVV